MSLDYPMYIKGDGNTNNMTMLQWYDCFIFYIWTPKILYLKYMRYIVWKLITGIAQSTHYHGYSKTRYQQMIYQALRVMQITKMRLKYHI